MDYILKFAISLSLLGALVIMTPVSKASTTKYTFNGAIESGSLIGENYSCSLTFDNANLKDSGSEWINLSSFKINFNSTSYNLSNSDFQSTADFQDGLFLGVSYSADNIDPSFALVSSTGSGLLEDVPYFSYKTASGDALNYSNISAVPLPGAIWLFGSCLGALLTNYLRKIIK